MSMKPTAFAQEGLKLARRVFEKEFAAHDIDHVLTVRVNALLASLKNAGYSRAFVYAEHYQGEILVTFDQTPNQGDGWAVKFYVKKAGNGAFHTMQAGGVNYVPDLAVAS